VSDREEPRFTDVNGTLMAWRSLLTAGQHGDQPLVAARPPAKPMVFKSVRDLSSVTVPTWASARPRPTSSHIIPQGQQFASSFRIRVPLGSTRPPAYRNATGYSGAQRSGECRQVPATEPECHTLHTAHLALLVSASDGTFIRDVESLQAGKDRKQTDQRGGRVQPIDTLSNSIRPSVRKYPATQRIPAALTVITSVPAPERRPRCYPA
jgi:hypothetical protein